MHSAGVRAEHMMGKKPPVKLDIHEWALEQTIQVIQ